MTKKIWTNEMLTGKSREHLVSLPCPFSDHHFLVPEAQTAFLALQQAAAKAGFNLQPASSFRDFSRQQLIWNNKFLGKRKVHNDAGKTLDLMALNDWQKCEAILRFSALPGASRHHWGTEIDIFDPNLLPTGQALQLEPWEYQKEGYFFELSQWLKYNAQQFDFTFPFLNFTTEYKIGQEPWHLSFLPQAQKANQAFNQETLLQAWEGENIAGKTTLITHLDFIFQHYWVK